MVMRKKKKKSNNKKKRDEDQDSNESREETEQQYNIYGGKTEKNRGKMKRGESNVKFDTSWGKFIYF